MIKRLLLFILLLISYLIVREMLNFYLMANQIAPWLGVLVLLLLFAVLIYFVLIPLYRISRVGGDPGPVRKRKRELALIEQRLQKAQKNPYLKEINFQVPTMGSAYDRYAAVNAVLETRCDEIRRKYVVHLFYSSAVSQYGFIDAILVFSANLNLAKEIFTLYTGRATGRDLWNITKQIYYAIAIGGSEGVEFATEELVSKLGSDTLKSIPFMERVLSSVADGYTNALLLTRISYIAENYCRMTYVSSTKELSPDLKTILSTTKAIVDEPLGQIRAQLQEIASQKVVDVTRYAINPARTVIEKAIDKFRPSHDDESEKQRILKSVRLGAQPMGLFSRVFSRKKKKP